MSNETSAKRNIQKLQRLIVDALEGVKAQDIQVFNTETLSPLFERVIVASGTSNRQTRALAMAVREAVKDAGFVKPRLEGEDNGEWIIVDCGQAVVHVMQPIIRQYYRLEELWGETPVRLASSKRVASHAKTFAREVAAVEDGTTAKGAKPSAKVAAKVTHAGAKIASPKPSIVSAKASPKTGAKTAVKSAVKAVGKVVAKAAAKPSAKAPAKAAVKRVAKPAVKSATKAPSKTVVVKKIVVKAKGAPAKKTVAKRAPRARSA
jgi:ribosome-associated protein